MNPLTNPAFFTARYRWDDGHILLLWRVAQNPAAARFYKSRSTDFPHETV